MHLIETTNGYARTRQIVNQLLADSAWFEVLPLPDMLWAVTAKDEPQNRLNFFGGIDELL